MAPMKLSGFRDLVGSTGRIWLKATPREFILAAAPVGLAFAVLTALSAVSGFPFGSEARALPLEFLLASAISIVGWLVLAATVKTQAALPLIIKRTFGWLACFTGYFLLFAWVLQRD